MQRARQTISLNFLVVIVAYAAVVVVKIVDCDVPRCDSKNPNFTPGPFCLPTDYNNDIVPETEGPLHINVDIWVFEVSRIDDIQGPIL